MILDGVGSNQCRYCRKAELNNKNEAKRPLLKGLFLVINSVLTFRNELNTKNNSSGQLKGGHLVSFLLSNLVFGIHSHCLRPRRIRS